MLGFAQPLAVLFAILLALSKTQVHGFSEPQDTSNSRSRHSGTAEQGDERPTLADLKKLGRLHSRFLSEQKRSANLDTPQSSLADFQTQLQSVLQRACADCHGPDTQEAHIRIDSLNPDLVHGGDVDRWLDVFSVLVKGEMPPADADPLSEQARGQLVDWLSNELQAASQARRESSKMTGFRRRTRYEYNYALQDLLGLPWNFAKDLPPEANADGGFQNNAELLHMSVSQVEAYHRLARRALNRAVVTGSQPPVKYWGVTMQESGKIDWAKQASQIEKLKEQYREDLEKQASELEQLLESFTQPPAKTHYQDLKTGRTTPATWQYGGAKYAMAPVDACPEFPASYEQVAVIPAGRNQHLTIELGEQIPDEGIMRVRVRASRRPTEQTSPPSLQLEFGWQASNEGRALMRISQEDTLIVAAADAPDIYQWDIPLGEIYPRNSVRKTSPMGALPSPSEYIRLVNSSATAAAVQVDFVQVAAPVYDQWPPASHQRIFFDSTQRSDEPAYAREILSDFMERAWARPVAAAELDQKLALFAAVRGDCNSFEEAMIEVLAAVLSSPNFLYVSVHPTVQEQVNAPVNSRISDHELAGRLALFLWCSIPDDELMALADAGQLSQADVLSKQVARLLDDPRSRRFSRHFVHQWLDMQLLDFMNFQQHIKSFDPLLKEAMQAEPVALFDEIMHSDGSILDFIHCDYAMANERLAKHYGLSGVSGNQFRRVELDGNYQLGGLLTQAGLLAMNSDWPDSHPLKRGIWLLECLLDDPPPPPPPAVPQIDLADPEIAKMTLKERIEDHRNQAACNSCHVKIDPWGIAFENYDAVGRWREQINGKPVDASSQLFNHQTLDGMDGLKRFLLQNRQDQFVRAFVHKVASYAVGRPLTLADRAEVDKITVKVRHSHDSLVSVIQSIVSSDLFLMPQK